MNPVIKILLLASAKGLLGNERVEVSAISCHLDGKLSLKANEPQFGQRHEGVERKRNTTTLLFSVNRLVFLRLSCTQKPFGLDIF